MIRTEHIDMEGRDFIRTFSDAGHYVVGGEPYGEYTEAIDPAEMGRTYTEGDLMPDDETDEAQSILNIILGDIE